MRNYIITQNKGYFIRSEIDAVWIEKYTLSSIIEKDDSKISIFLYDHNRKKIYGRYVVDTSIVADSNDGIYRILYLGHHGRRRGVFYYDKNIKYDFKIYEIESDISDSIYKKILSINSPLNCSIFSTYIKNNIFYLKYIDITKDFYIAEFKTKIDGEAFNLLQKKYNMLINKSQSEKEDILSFISLGNAFMNMFLPDRDFNELLIRNHQVIYLECDKKTSLIPWTIFALDNIFLSSNITFSYLHSKNCFYGSLRKKQTKYSMAIITIEHDDLKYSQDESSTLLDVFSNVNNISVDTYNKNLDYFEFIEICENYDIVHIITHGTDDGIMLSKDYVLKYISIKNLTNPPRLIFLSTCNPNIEQIYNQNIISSFLTSGVKSIITSIGKVPDKNDTSFICDFYKNYMHKHSDINTALAYNFAINNNKNSNIRYLFFGIPTH